MTEGATRGHYDWPGRNVSELLFTAFSKREDAIELAHKVGKGLSDEGVASELHLLDRDPLPTLDDRSLVVSLGGDGTFLKAARLAHLFDARVLAVNLRGPFNGTQAVIPHLRNRGGGARQVMSVAKARHQSD